MVQSILYCMILRGIYLQYQSLPSHQNRPSVPMGSCWIPTGADSIQQRWKH
ncbi:hypothetical protein LINGRAHAP2_LOCUS7934 [Linum grandiflorum]